MADGSKIQWTDATWSVSRGCSVISAGCLNCYAATMAARFAGPGQPFEGTIDYVSKASGLKYANRAAAGASVGRWNGNVQLVDAALTIPLRWQRARRIFVNSMSDLFHEAIPDDYIDQVFAVMAMSAYVGRCRKRACDHDPCDNSYEPVAHTFQVLTKRADRMLAYLADPATPGRVRAAAHHIPGWSVGEGALDGMAWPLPNVHVGVSVENQAAAKERIPLLARVPAVVRFLSIEPLIGPVFLPWVGDMDAIGWIIVGGESGPKARPCHVEWIRQIVDDAADAECPVFVKQLGAYVSAPDPFTTNGSGFPTGGTLAAMPGWERIDMTGDPTDRWRVRLKDSRGGNPAEWPHALKVREFPGERA